MANAIMERTNVTTEAAIDPHLTCWSVRATSAMTAPAATGRKTMVVSSPVNIYSAFRPHEVMKMGSGPREGW